MTTPEEMRTIYVERQQQGDPRREGKASTTAWFKLTIPATAKVTFGPLMAGGPDRYGNGGLYLRVYKTKDHQLAVIPNVVQFRDASITYERPNGGSYIPISEEELIGQSVIQELNT